MAIVVAELILRKIAVQVLFADRMVNAVDTALHDGEEAFNGVAVNISPRTYSFALWQTDSWPPSYSAPMPL